LGSPELPSHPGVDVPELPVTIRMPGTLFRLAIRLQAVSQPIQQLAHQPIAGSMLPRRQLPGQQPRALAGPPQGRLGIPPTHRIDQGLQRRPQARIDGRCALAPTPPPPNAPPLRPSPRPRLLHSSDDRAPGDPRRPGHQGCAPVTKSLRLRSRPEPARPFIQRPLEHPKLPANHLELRHALSIARSGSLCHLFSRGPLGFLPRRL
jgi:hypothetical protein